MKRTLLSCLAAFAFVAIAAAADWGDAADQALGFSNATGSLRAQLTGSLELEGYAFDEPAPGLIDAPGTTLFSPRLTAFLDAQLGPNLYGFAQARVDRGFDPSVDPLTARFDEYALRLTPFAGHRFSLQVGKFATVVGNWVSRHLAWDNPLITAPLAYEELTAVWDAEPARSLNTLLGWAHLHPVPGRPVVYDDKYLRLPIVWGPSYATGAAVSGEVGHFNYAAEVKNASLSARPDRWRGDPFDPGQPTVSARVGYQPDLRWTFGVSASSGSYLSPGAPVPAGRSRAGYRQIVFGQDAAFAWHHVQVWAEVYEARFAIPGVGNADVLSYYLEARYKLTPQLFVAGRWNQELYGQIDQPTGGSARWGADTSRGDIGFGYRFTAHSEVKAQISLQHQAPAPRETTLLGAVQLLLRF